MIDHEITATSLTATASTQTQSPHQAAPPGPGAARPELWVDPRDIHSINRWHHATRPTLEELDTYDRAESLLHESQHRRRQHQQNDRESALDSTEAHEPLSRCWVHEASYVRWYDFYIRNGEAAEAARAMASYQAGESRCILCCLFDGPGDAATQPAPATEHDSHPDAPFHTTSTDGHDDGTDSNDDDAPATPSAADDGGHAADGGARATDPWPPAPPRSALITGPRQHARDATDPYIAAAGPPPHGPPGPTHVRTAHQPPAPIPPLSPRPTPPPTAPPTPARPPVPSPTPTPTPQQPPQQSGAPRTHPGIVAGLLTATALAALALHDERPDRPRDIARTATRRARQPPRLTLLGGILLLAAAARSLPKAASSPAPAPGADRTTPPLPLTAMNEPGTPAPAAYAANLANALTATDMDATTQVIIDHEISATSDTATAGHLQSGDTQAPLPIADDGDGATAQAAETTVAVPPPYLSRFHQAAHDPRTRPRWRLHNNRRWLAPDDAEPLERTPATLHRADVTIRDAITALYCHQPITRGALAIGHGWRTCATCIPSGVLGHEPWRCQRVGAITMRWELRDPWSNAVYCCISCYTSGGQEHDEWDTSESGALPCTSDWPEGILTTLLGPPPAHHQHADPTGPPVTSIHLAAHMDDAADPTEDAGAEGHQLAELIYERLRTATRHVNAPTVVLITVLHLLRTSDLAAAVAAVVPGLQAAMEAAPPHETHTTPPGSPDSQEQAQQPTPPSPPRNWYQDATPTERRPPPPFPRPEPNTGRPPPPLPPPPLTITEEHVRALARRMAHEDDADRIQEPDTIAPEHDIRANYHAMSRQTKAAQETVWMLQAHIDHFQARRTEQNRLYRATARQWRMRDWLVRNIDTDEEGTETVNGYPSHAWNTDLEGYLSTDTHCGNTDEYYWGDHQAPPPRSDEDDVFVDDEPSDDGAAPPAPSDDGSIFLDDGDTNSSDYYYSPASPDEAATEEGTDPAPAHDSPYRTSTQTPEHDSEPAPTDTSTPEPATEPAHVDSDAPADDRDGALDEHDDEATAKAPDTSAPSTEPPAAADDPVAAARPDHGTQSHAHPPPSRPEPAPKRVREDASSAGPAQAALQHRSRPEAVHASGATRPAPPPPHPDIQIAQCTTPGCSRPPLFTEGACCRDCGDAARTGAAPCHSPECDAFHRDHPPGISGDDDNTEPAPPSVPHDTYAPDAPPDTEATPPPRPLSLPTPAPRRTPTPTPTPLPPQQAAHAPPQALPPQQSLARRRTPCPLLWCLLVGASILMCLPTHAEHNVRNVRKQPARRPRPAASDAMIALLIVLGAGAAPCAMSAPWSTHAATQSWLTGHNLSSCPTHAAPSAPAAPPAHLVPALRPPPARPQHTNPTPANPDAGTRRARWSIAGMIAAATLLLAHPYLASAADHHHGSHRRHHQHHGGGAASAPRATAAPRSAHSAPASGASDQPLDVYAHPRAQQSNDMVATSRDANAQGMHASRGGAHAARMRRSGNRVYIDDDRGEAAGDAPDSDSDAGSDGSDADAKANDREIYTLPLYALGCCISAVDAPHNDFMSPDAGDAGGTPASATATATHGRSKRRRVQQVVTHHQAVSLAITVWRQVRDGTGTYYVIDEVVAVHVGLHLRGAFSLAPLTSPRGQILCMVMAAHYARLYRRLPHAMILSRYTSHHVAIRNGTGATDVRDIATGVRWLAEQFQDDPHHIGSGSSDCVGRLRDGTLAATTILDITTNHIRSISNTNARGTEHAELVATALEACDYFGEPRIQAALQDWRAAQPNDLPPSPGAGATATAASPMGTPALPAPGHRPAAEDDDSLGARPEGARAAAAAPPATSLTDRLRTSADSPGGDDPSDPEPRSDAPRRRSATAPAPEPEPAPLPPAQTAAAAATPDGAPQVEAADDDGGGDTEEEQI